MKLIYCQPFQADSEVNIYPGKTLTNTSKLPLSSNTMTDFVPMHDDNTDYGSGSSGDCSLADYFSSFIPYSNDNITTNIKEYLESSIYVVLLKVIVNVVPNIKFMKILFHT